MMLCNTYLLYLLLLIFIYNKTQSFVTNYVKLLFKFNQYNSNNKELIKLYISSKNTNNLHNNHSSKNSKKNVRRSDLIQSNKMKANFTTTTSSSSSISSSTTISDINSMNINYVNNNNQQRNKHHNIDNIINYLKVHMNTITSTSLMNYIYELTNNNNNNNNHDHKDKDKDNHYVSNYYNNQELKSLIITILHRVSSQLTAYELSRLLVCMARMDISWDKVNRIEPLMKQLLYLLSSNQHHHHHQQQYQQQQQYSTSSSSSSSYDNNNNIELYIGDIVWSLGTMNARWDRFSSIERDAILQAISDNIHTMSSYTLSSTIWAMAKMGMKLYVYVYFVVMMLIIIIMMMVMMVMIAMMML